MEKQDFNKCKCTQFTNGVLLGTGFLLIVFFVITIIAILFREPLSHFYDKHIMLCNSISTIDLQKDTLDSLLKKNQIVSVSDILTDLNSFYTVVITILGIFLGLSGLLGYIHIRALSKQTIEDEVSQHFKHYTQTLEFAQKVSSQVDNALEGTQVDDINYKIAQLENQIEKLQSFQSVSYDEIIPQGEINGDNQK